MRLINYFKNSYKELVQKVTWPSWSSLQNSAIVVMIASLLFAVVVLVIDVVFQNFMQNVYNLLY